MNDYAADDDILVNPTAGSPSVENENVPFYTRHGSIICGAPEMSAPDMIRFIDDDGNIDPVDPNYDFHCAFIRQPKTQTDLENVFEAMGDSCISCVRYRGTNENILKLMIEEELAVHADALQQSAKDGES